MDVAADVAVGVAVNVKAFRYRIYPTDEQEAFFRQIAGCRRFVYNWALTERRAAWAAVKAAKKAANAPAKAGASAQASAAQPSSAQSSSAQASSARSLSYIDQQNRLPALKAGHPFLRDVPSHCLQAALRDLESAYKAFFKGLADKPTFASRDDGRSFRFPDPAQMRIEVEEDPERRCSGKGFSRKSGKKPLRGFLILPKCGKSSVDHGPVAIRLHRKLVGDIRRITVSQDGAAWYASIETRTESAPVAVFDGAEPAIVAVDRNGRRPFVSNVKVAMGVALSPEERRAPEIRPSSGAPQGGGASTRRMTDDLVDPTETPEIRARRALLQRRVARKARDSKNRAKARGALRAFEHKQRRKRVHKARTAAKAVVRAADVVALERLNLKAMTKSAGRRAAEQASRGEASRSEASGGQTSKGVSEPNPISPALSDRATRGRNRQMADATLGMFARFVEENARKAGVPVIYVNPAYTSRTCPDCGNRDKANRPCGSPTFTCVACGHAARADKVAAINIARKGKVAWDALRAEAALAPPASALSQPRDARG